jgi:hypothetical protein
MHVLTYDDWRTHFTSELVALLDVPYLWNSVGIGSVNVTASFYPTLLVQGFLAKVGFDFGVIERALYMVPIIIFAPLGAYLLCNAIVAHRLAAVMGSLIFVFNTYFILVQTRHLTIATAYALFPLALYFLLKLLRGSTILSAIKFGLVASVLAAYDFRIFYILAFVTCFLTLAYLVNMLIERRQIAQVLRVGLLAALSLVIPVLLNLYWLYGLSKTASLEENAVISRGLFGNGILNINYALALFLPFWNGAKPEWFALQSIPPFFWLVPAIAAAGLYLGRRNRFVILFGCVALLGVLLTKQVAEPFTAIYPWLYSNLPGFNVFREASKFYVLIAVGYAVLVSAFFACWRRHARRFSKRIIVYLPYGAIASLIVIVILPLMTGTIGTLFTERTIPQDYVTLKEFQARQTGHYRVLWLPQESRWSYYDNRIKNINADVLFKAHGQEKASSKRYIEAITDLMRTGGSEDILRMAGVRYVVVPLRDVGNDDDFYVYYSHNKQAYLDLLNSLNWLKKVDIGTRDVAVYENSKYNSYISASDTMYSIGKESPDRYKNVAHSGVQTSAKQFDYVQSEVNVRSLANIKTLFKDGSNETVQQLNSKDYSNMLFADASLRGHRYVIDQGNMHVYQKANDSVAVNRREIASSAEKLVASVRLEPNGHYALGIGKLLKRIDAQQGARRDVGYGNEEVSLYQYSTQNLIKNGSFESSIWTNSSEKCNDNGVHTKSDSIDTTQQFTTSGTKSLRMNAEQFIACADSETLPVSGGERYALSYKFKILFGQRVGYRLVFNDKAKTVVDNSLSMRTGDFSAVNDWFTVPQGASQVTIRLLTYPDEQNKRTALAVFDNVEMRKIKVVATIADKRSPQFTKYDLAASEVLDARVTREASNISNEIANGSLEDGLWQQDVDDCNSHDDRPAIDMKLSDNASDGIKSLLLSAKRHVACTGIDNIAVEEGRRYTLSFNYMSPNAQQAGYYIRFNDNDSEAYGERIDIEDKAWRLFTKTIDVPYGATKMSIQVYSYSDDYSADYQLNYYDNFRLSKAAMTEGRYYLMSTPKHDMKPPEQVTFRDSSPTEKIVHIRSASSGFYLNFSERYHDAWKADVIYADHANKATTGAKRINDAEHHRWGGTFNTWFINPSDICTNDKGLCVQNSDGSWDMKLALRFLPQSHMNRAALLSLAVFVGCVLYLLYASVSRSPEVSAARRGRVYKLKSR